MSDSFLGDIRELPELDREYRVVETLHFSEKGPFRVLLTERMGKRFVIKCLKPEFKEDKVYAMMLRREFEIGFSLSYPYIVTTLSFEEIDGLGPCIVEEYVSGTTFEQFIKTSSTDDQTFLEILRKIVGAVVYLHGKQTAHYDLKPANIIISDFDYTPKIIDFGFSDTSAYNSLKFRGGTHSYAAPEQLDENQQEDSRSDLWALGKIIGEVADRGGRYSRSLKKISKKCLKEKEERIQSAGDLLNELKKLDKKSIPSAGNLGYLFVIISLSIAVLILMSRSRREESYSEAETVSTVDSLPVSQSETVESPVVNQTEDAGKKEADLKNIQVDDPAAKDRQLIEDLCNFAESYTEKRLEKAWSEYDEGDVMAVNNTVQQIVEEMDKRVAETKFSSSEARHVAQDQVFSVSTSTMRRINRRHLDRKEKDPN